MMIGYLTMAPSSRPSRENDHISQMRLDDLDTRDDEVDSDSSFDADGEFTFEDGEDVRDRDYSDFNRQLSSPENHNSCCFLNSLSLMLFSCDVTYAYLYVLNLPDLGPIISGLS
jgi:hypothetical protein